MRVWRLCAPEHAHDPLGGRGGLYAGGRWHRRGTRIVYTSATLSLAALEMLVHAERVCLPQRLISLEIEIPDHLPVEEISEHVLPVQWRSYPAPGELQALGQAWLDQGERAVLSVPSVIVPEERNFLINPLHPASARIQVLTAREFSFDPRLLASE